MGNFIKELFSFNGRWNRFKFWIYPLSILLFLPFLAIISFVGMQYSISPIILMISMSIIYLLIFYITLVAYIKRLHDLDKSGWFSLIMFVPILGFFLLIYCGFFKGTPGKNRFGNNPLGNNIEYKIENNDSNIQL